jgi:membrane dipeptidase
MGEARVFVVDAHEDIAYNALHHERDVRRSVKRTRELEAASLPCCVGPVLSVPETAMVGLPEHKLGGVGAVFSTIFTLPGELEAVHEDGLAQVRYYQELAREDTGVRIITTRGELAVLREDWDAAETESARPVGFVLLMEGADPIREPAELEEWYALGLRIVGPAWQRTRYCGGTRAPGPLTELGHDLLRVMDRLGVTLDVSHFAEESFWDALGQFEGRVIASHSNCREYTPTDRHLSDDMIRALAERDAVIGTVLSNAFLVGGWRAETSEPVHLDAVVRHIDRICQLTGSARHCGLGSDFDGGFGVETTPEEFDSVADLARVSEALGARGYAAADIEGIVGGNWLRLLREALPTH